MWCGLDKFLHQPKKKFFFLNKKGLGLSRENIASMIQKVGIKQDECIERDKLK
jgi:hypothetical protein